MSFAAGALSKVLIGQSTAVLSSAAATGGTGPYTYQWYSSTTTGFSPGPSNIISGATSLSLSQSGLIPGATNYYVVVATDTGNGNVTANSSQLTVVQEPSLSQNQFAQTPLVGVVDLAVGLSNVVAAQVDASVTSQVYPGQAVKLVANNNGGIWKVAPVSASNDAAIGFAKFNIKDIQYVAGQNLEVALWGSVIWCYATGAITQGNRVCLDASYVGGVQATGNSATVMGTAFDGAAAAGLIRVMLLPNGAYTTA